MSDYHLVVVSQHWTDFETGEELFFSQKRKADTSHDHFNVVFLFDRFNIVIMISTAEMKMSISELIFRLSSDRIIKAVSISHISSGIHGFFSKP